MKLKKKKIQFQNWMTDTKLDGDFIWIDFAPLWVLLFLSFSMHTSFIDYCGKKNEVFVRKLVTWNLTVQTHYQFDEIETGIDLESLNSYPPNYNRTRLLWSVDIDETNANLFQA